MAPSPLLRWPICDGLRSRMVDIVTALGIHPLTPAVVDEKLRLILVGLVVEARSHPPERRTATPKIEEIEI